MSKWCLVLILLGTAAMGCRKPTPGPAPAASPSPLPTPQVSIPVVLGIPECDEYLFKFQNCLQTKVPDLAKIPLQIGMQRAVEEWKKRAAIPDKRPEVGPACLLAMQASKPAMEKFKCQW